MRDTDAWEFMHRHIRTLSFIMALGFVIFSYLPFLMPLLDSKLEFCYGDLSYFIGIDSAAVRAEYTFNTFDYGSSVPEANRAFLLESASIFMGWIGASDSQTTSLILLATIILGCIGLEALIGLIDGTQTGWTGAAIRLAVIPFYFLNLWSVDRIIHIWIWFTYAILPLLLFLGLSYLGKKGRMEILIAYALIMAIYGMVPHSLMYAAIIHAFLAIYACAMLLRSNALDSKKAVLFIALPCVIYILTNLPVLLLPAVSGLSYPYTIDMDMLSYLSNNGELIRALTIADNWWPPIQYSLIYDNALYRVSSLAIIAITVLLSAFMLRGMDESSRWLTPFSIAFILCALFIAQGMNNPFINASASWLESHGLLWTTSLFREWARICVMIPVFLAVAFLAAASAARNRTRTVLVLAMLSLVFVNIVSSPAWAEFQKYAPVHVPDDYYNLSAILPGSGKTLMIWQTDQTMVNSNGAYAWNPEKSRSTTLDWFNDGYGGNMMDIIANEEAPQGLLDILGIRYVIKSKEGLGGQAFPAGYDWLGCHDMPYFIICDNNDSIARFSVYGGAILAKGDPLDHYGLYFLNLSGIAVSSDNGPWSRYTLVNGSDAKPVNDGGAGNLPLYLLEAEKDFRTDNGEVMDLHIGRLASGGHILEAKHDTTFSKTITVPKEGEYTFAFRGQGNFTLSSGGTGSSISTKKMGYIHIPVHMKQGEQIISIDAEAGSFFDSLVIYPQDGNKTLDQLFGPVPPGTMITSYERSSPTRWEAKVDSSGPFLLSFAESFSPYWEARVYHGGELVETAKSIKLFDSMNGFWINTTGKDIDVKVVFAPQEGFEYAIAVSTLTMTACAIFIVKSHLDNHDTRKKAGRRTVE